MALLKLTTTVATLLSVMIGPLQSLVPARDSSSVTSVSVASQHLGPAADVHCNEVKDNNSSKRDLEQHDLDLLGNVTVGEH